MITDCDLPVLYSSTIYDFVLVVHGEGKELTCPLPGLPHSDIHGRMLTRAMHTWRPSTIQTRLKGFCLIPKCFAQLHSLRWGFAFMQERRELHFGGKDPALRIEGYGGAV